jgi:hypothetical protein
VEESEKLQSISSDEVNTDLHNAVLVACKCDEANDSHNYNDIDLLMSGATNLNMPNKKGYNEIGIAAEFPHKKTVKHMLKQDKDGCLYLDYYPGDSESTVKEIIMQTYPDVQPLLPAPLMEILDSSNTDKKNYLLHFSMMNTTFMVNLSTQITLTLGLTNLTIPLY